MQAMVFQGKIHDVWRSRIVVNCARPKGIPLGPWKAFMDYFLYILRSLDNLHWYIGSTNNIKKRLGYHNRGNSKATKFYKPWQIVYIETFTTRSDAIKREMFLKSPKGYQTLLKIKKGC